MINPKDIDFHLQPNADHTYAETNFFCFTIPEHNLMVSAYTVTRKALGVMSADVIVFGDLVSDRAECLYIDNHQHLPAPEKLSDYRTANGLSVKALNPRDYRVDYTGFDGVEFHIDFKGLMEPFDIHDPAHSPKAKATVAEQHAGSGLGAGYGGHFDLTGHVTGIFKWKGRDYAVNCVETMDHSWGPRPELGIASMGWMHGHFGPDLAIHWIVAWNPSKPAGEQHTLAHGYVLDKGVVYGLTDLKMRSTRIGRTLTAMDVEVTDRRGQVFKLSGAAQIGAPWVCYVAIEVYAAMMRWRLSDGRIGYGMCQEAQSIQSANRRLGRHDIQGTAAIAA